MSRTQIVITNHAIKRWRQRIEGVPEAQALADMLTALQTADAKHFKPSKLKKRTFYIPTSRAMFVGTLGKIVTVLERGQSPYDAEFAAELLRLNKEPPEASFTNADDMLKWLNDDDSSSMTPTESKK